eukprot:Nk52_evm15s2640 gene=Nk52_evmTU15s2640
MNIGIHQLQQKAQGTDREGVQQIDALSTAVEVLKKSLKTKLLTASACEGNLRMFQRASSGSEVATLFGLDESQCIHSGEFYEAKSDAEIEVVLGKLVENVYWLGRRVCDGGRSMRQETEKNKRSSFLGDIGPFDSFSGPHLDVLSLLKDKSMHQFRLCKEHVAVENRNGSGNDKLVFSSRTHDGMHESCVPTTNSSESASVDAMKKVNDKDASSNASLPLPKSLHTVEPKKIACTGANCGRLIDPDGKNGDVFIFHGHPFCEHCLCANTFHEQHPLTANSTTVVEGKRYCLSCVCHSKDCCTPLEDHVIEFKGKEYCHKCMCASMKHTSEGKEITCVDGQWWCSDCICAKKGCNTTFASANDYVEIECAQEDGTPSKLERRCLAQCVCASKKHLIENGNFTLLNNGQERWCNRCICYSSDCTNVLRNGYVTMSGKNYCKECSKSKLKCSICTKAIVDGDYEIDEEHFCRDCVCGNCYAIVGPDAKTILGSKYCTNCLCHKCETILSNGFYSLKGRRFCKNCTCPTKKHPLSSKHKSVEGKNWCISCLCAKCEGPLVKGYYEINAEEYLNASGEEADSSKGWFTSLFQNDKNNELFRSLTERAVRSKTTSEPVWRICEKCTCQLCRTLLPFENSSAGERGDMQLCEDCKCAGCNGSLEGRSYSIPVANATLKHNKFCANCVCFGCKSKVSAEYSTHKPSKSNQVSDMTKDEDYGHLWCRDCCCADPLCKKLLTSDFIRMAGYNYCRACVCVNGAHLSGQGKQIVNGNAWCRDCCCSDPDCRKPFDESNPSCSPVGEEGKYCVSCVCVECNGTARKHHIRFEGKYWCPKSQICLHCKMPIKEGEKEIVKDGLKYCRKCICANCDAFIEGDFVLVDPASVKSRNESFVVRASRGKEEASKGKEIADATGRDVWCLDCVCANTDKCARPLGEISVEFEGKIYCPQCVCASMKHLSGDKAVHINGCWWCTDCVCARPSCQNVLGDSKKTKDGLNYCPSCVCDTCESVISDNRSQYVEFGGKSFCNDCLCNIHQCRLPLRDGKKTINIIKGEDGIRCCFRCACHSCTTVLGPSRAIGYNESTKAMFYNIEDAVAFEKEHMDSSLLTFWCKNCLCADPSCGFPIKPESSVTFKGQKYHKECVCASGAHLAGPKKITKENGDTWCCDCLCAEPTCLKPLEGEHFKEIFPSRKRFCEDCVCSSLKHSAGPNKKVDDLGRTWCPDCFRNRCGDPSCNNILADGSGVDVVVVNGKTFCRNCVCTECLGLGNDDQHLVVGASFPDDQDYTTPNSNSNKPSFSSKIIICLKTALCDNVCCNNPLSLYGYKFIDVPYYNQTATEECENRKKLICNRCFCVRCMKVISLQSSTHYESDEQYRWCDECLCSRSKCRQPLEISEEERVASPFWKVFKEDGRYEGFYKQEVGVIKRQGKLYCGSCVCYNCFELVTENAVSKPSASEENLTTTDFPLMPGYKILPENRRWCSNCTCNACDGGVSNQGSSARINKQLFCTSCCCTQCKAPISSGQKFVQVEERTGKKGDKVCERCICQDCQKLLDRKHLKTIYGGKVFCSSCICKDCSRPLLLYGDSVAGKEDDEHYQYCRKCKCSKCNIPFLEKEELKQESIKRLRYGDVFHCSDCGCLRCGGALDENCKVYESGKSYCRECVCKKCDNFLMNHEEGYCDSCICKYCNNVLEDNEKEFCASCQALPDRHNLDVERNLLHQQPFMNTTNAGFTVKHLLEENLKETHIEASGAHDWHPQTGKASYIHPEPGISVATQADTFDLNVQLSKLKSPKTSASCQTDAAPEESFGSESEEEGSKEQLGSTIDDADDSSSSSDADSGINEKDGTRHNDFEDLCYNCDKILANNLIVEAFGRKYHQQCFLCKICFKSLGSTGYFKLNNEPFCGECYGKHTGLPRCHECNLLVSGAYVSWKDYHWHRDCYKCKDCASQYRKALRSKLKRGSISFNRKVRKRRSSVNGGGEEEGPMNDSTEDSIDDSDSDSSTASFDDKTVCSTCNQQEIAH